MTEFIIIVLMFATALAGLVMGIRKRDIPTAAVMVFLICFSLWLSGNHHRIGNDPEPVRMAKGVRV